MTAKTDRTAPDHERAAAALSRLLDHTGITVRARVVPQRTDRDPDDWSPTAKHLAVEIFKGETVVMRTEYSIGSGIAEQYVQAAPFCKKVLGWGQDRDMLNNPPRRNSIGFLSALDKAFGHLIARSFSTGIEKAWERPYDTQMRRTRTKLRNDVVAALLMDAGGSDEFFEDWAADLGMPTDSIKAKQMWDRCNDTRRQLQSILHGKYGTATRLAHEL